VRQTFQSRQDCSFSDWLSAFFERVILYDPAYESDDDEEDDDELKSDQSDSDSVEEEDEHRV